MKHVFQNPFVFEGETYKDIEIAVENLTGKDLKAALKKHQGIVAPALDADVRDELLSKAAKQPMEFFEALPIAEYNELSQLMINFLFKQGWGEQIR